jgi:hypothetical protein
MNICGGEGWEELCGFLGECVPERPFPHIRPQPWTRASFNHALVCGGLEPSTDNALGLRGSD